jgi:two-component system response regulator AtoC
LKGIEQVQLVVSRAAERKSFQLVKERESRSRESVERPLTYGDPSMAEPVRALEKVAATDATVLLLGESGTGKEVAARQLHRWSARRDGPFVAINCAAVSANLLESELFGHEKGAFTSADKRRVGRLELAEGGTFFLDEVGELSLELQAKLLRVLETKQFERVGGTVTLDARVRWVAATNRDLAACVADGTFRNDLFHRLAVFPVHLPALRDRPRDILPIARVLIEGIAGDLGKGALTLGEDAERFIRTQAWPGNVRELRNALERAAILADDTTIRERDLTWANRTGAAQVTLPDQLVSMEDYERSAIETALTVCGGSRREAAKRLQIAERTLYDKLKRFGLS